jgi:hypothetical protein
MAFFTQNTGSLCKQLIITVGFKKNAIFSPKIGENRENCYHNNRPGGGGGGVVFLKRSLGTSLRLRRG